VGLKTRLVAWKIAESSLLQATNSKEDPPGRICVLQ
jgi:hypothetical protein